MEKCYLVFASNINNPLKRIIHLWRRLAKISTLDDITCCNKTKLTLLKKKFIREIMYQNKLRCWVISMLWPIISFRQVAKMILNEQKREAIKRANWDLSNNSPVSSLSHIIWKKNWSRKKSQKSFRLAQNRRGLILLKAQSSCQFFGNQRKVNFKETTKKDWDWGWSISNKQPQGVSSKYKGKWMSGW